MNTPASGDVAPSNPLAIRGLLVDAARMPESPAHYRRVIDFCQAWGFNTILLRLTDDQGCALRFVSHPELITHRNALTTTQARELVAYASARGVDVIPEIESFGHCTCITAVPEHRELADDDGSRHGDLPPFTGLIPTHPKTRAIMADLYREVAELFPSRYLHGGCDEISWGGSQMSKDAIEKHGRANVWAEYVNHLAGLAKSQGKEFIIWADHVLRKEGGTVDLLDKDIILYDWDYWTHEPAELKKHADRALAAGFRILGGPAMNWCRWGPRVGAPQLYNMNAFADVYRELAAANPRVLGVIVTHWVPGRYMSGSQWDHYAYAAVALGEGGTAAYDHALRRYIEQHFSATWDETWADAMWSLYHFAPSRTHCAPKWTRPVLPTPWRSDDTLRLAVTAGRQVSPPFARVLTQLQSRRGSVRSNIQDFDDLCLVTRYLAHLHEREVLVSRAASGGADAGATIKSIAAEDAALLAAMDGEWDRTRFTDSPGKSVSLAKLGPEDQMLAAFREASVYSAHLASDPRRFETLLKPA